MRRIRAELVRAADPTRAPGMQAYLKARLPCYGVYLPELVAIGRRVFPEAGITTRSEWRAAVALVWRNATHVEERSLAILLAGFPRFQELVSPAVLPLYRRMIVEGAWWDTVDALAHRVGDLFARWPARIEPVLRAWSRHENIWLRRVAIIAQVGARADTDWNLLVALIRPSLGSKEFFLRKAIGWALREYAKTEPAVVRRYLRDAGRSLAPLARREAMKGLAFVRRHGRLRQPRVRAR